jgi:sugar phosphate isomerase/epimerase
LARTHNPGRRHFIKTASVWPLGVAAGVGLESVFAAGQQPVRRIGGPRLKISLNAYSFNGMLTAPSAGGKPARTLFDVLDFCARENFDGIDPTGYYFPGYPNVPPDSFVNDFKRRAFQLGIAITGTGVRNNFAQADRVKRAADVQLVKDWIEVAAKLGAPVIRVFAGTEPKGHSRTDVAEWMAADLKECAEHGKRYGVLIGIQNHGDFLKTSDQVLQILKMVDSDWFGVVVDTGNFQSGDPYEEIGRTVSYAVNFQVKESPYGSVSPVRTDLKKLVGVICAGGYRGYLPIETLAAPGQPYDPFVKVSQFLREVRDAIES